MGQSIAGLKEVTDQTGLETLDNIAQANRFNRWMYETISRDMTGNILEIGSGIGNISAHFLENRYSISLSDMRQEYCDFLRQKFEEKSNLKGIYQIDIIDPDFDKKHGDLFETFDGVFALNIIEHVENDDLAVKNCLKLIKKDGMLVILVPAFMSLFNPFDEGLGHYRRYTRKNLEQQFRQNNIRVLKSRYFNFAGTLGWWFSGNILKKKSIPTGQIKIYNSLVWLFRIVDHFTNSFVGLSVIITGRKQP
ncbi:class I SAM-dependent methyltransferase [Mariniphaga sediminis]|uniref:class I SAM-dependent methyltransferase n=1 Tax=Mariniphaga sediminis TaxID=1628158 RepID=UPI00356219BE